MDPALLGVFAADGRAGTALRLLWAAPCSLIGLVLAVPLLLGGGRARRVGPAIEVALRDGELPENSPLRRFPLAAITFGHVILGASGAQLERVRGHEHVHVRQYERLGPLMLLAYPLASLVALLRGRRGYHDNWFEVQARGGLGSSAPSRREESTA